VAGLAEAFQLHGEHIAGVILEPVVGNMGLVVPRPEFLTELRRLTERHGALLIMDEVISLRLAPGGAQAVYGVQPDLTTMGKIIGGGYPVAAFGGRADILALLDPRGGGPAIPHGGTFNGNPVGAAAGIATLEILTPEVYARLNQLGDALRARLNALFERLGVAMQVTGMGSLFNLHACRTPIVDYASSRAGANAASRALVLGLLNEGVFLAPRGLGCITLPMAEPELDTLVAAVERVLTAQG
jgi:glutamate-1-semialdehyde 2,1-aminomutase